MDWIDTAAGRLALVLLLAGAEPGNYGIRETADDGVLPPIEPAACAEWLSRLTILIAARDEEARIGTTVDASCSGSSRDAEVSSPTTARATGPPTRPRRPEPGCSGSRTAARVRR